MIDDNMENCLGQLNIKDQTSASVGKKKKMCVNFFH